MRNMGVGVGGSFLVERISPDGTLLDRTMLPNTVTNDGLYMFSKLLITEDNMYDRYVPWNPSSERYYDNSRSGQDRVLYYGGILGSTGERVSQPGQYVGRRSTIGPFTTDRSLPNLSIVWRSDPALTGTAPGIRQTIATTRTQDITRTSTSGANPFTATGRLLAGETWRVTWRLSFQLDNAARLTQTQQAALLAFLYECMTTDRHIGSDGYEPFAFAEFQAQVPQGQRPSSFTWRPGDQTFTSNHIVRGTRLPHRESLLAQRYADVVCDAPGPTPDRTSSRLARTGMLLGSSSGGTVASSGVVLDYQADGSTFDWGPGIDGGLLTCRISFRNV